MSKRNVKLFLACCLTFLFYDCKKSCPHIEPIIIQDEMKDWVAFRPGSYWIYKDSISGKFDTVSIHNFEFKLIESSNTENSCPNKKQQEMKINMQPDSIHNPKNYEFYGIYDLDINDNLKGKITFRKADNRALNSPYLLFPLNIGDSLKYGSKSMYVTEKIVNTLRVAGKTYKGVLCVYDNFNYVLRGESRFYHVKNLGVVKKVVYKHDSKEAEQIWELVDWDVIQEQ